MPATTGEPDDRGPASDGAVRASDAERESFARLLQGAFSEGRLDMGELDERLSRAYAAKTLSELRELVKDLPSGSIEPGVPLSSRGLRSADEQTLRPGAGGLTRSGDWVVPGRLVIETKYGSVKLDLRTAVIDRPEVEIVLDMHYGGAKILLPSGVTADADELTCTWGFLKLSAPAARVPGMPHVSVKGRNVYGWVTIRPA